MTEKRLTVAIAFNAKRFTGYEHLNRAVLVDQSPIGLHYEDVTRLIAILKTLVDRVNTVLLMEHNLDVCKCSDHIIDIGPEGGPRGGTIVAKGPPEQVANVKESHTGQYLRRVLI